MATAASLVPPEDRDNEAAVLRAALAHKQARQAADYEEKAMGYISSCLLYTSPSPRDS